MERLPYDVFVDVIRRGKIKGQDLVNLCETSKTLYEYGERAYIVKNKDGGIVEIRKQNLFRMAVIIDFKIKVKYLDLDFPVRAFYGFLAKNSVFVKASILTKIKAIRKFAIDSVDYLLYHVTNLYDLLYNPSADDDRDTVGSHVMNWTKVLYESFKNSQQLVDSIEEQIMNAVNNINASTPEKLFFEVLDEIDDLEPYTVYDLTGKKKIYTYDKPSEILDDHHKNVIFDYNFMKSVFKITDDSRFDTIFQLKTGIKAIDLKFYPAMFAKKLRSYPSFLDFKLIKEIIRRETDSYITTLYTLLPENNEDENEIKIAYEQAESSPLKFTEEELDYLVDLHKRVIDVNSTLRINMLVFPDE
jgi:hypothetical protein